MEALYVVGGCALFFGPMAWYVDRFWPHGWGFWVLPHVLVFSLYLVLVT